MNKNDLRYMKTEKNIRKAFLDCTKEIGFHKTRVSDICQKASISRNTFYDHYLDKYDLIDKLLLEFKTRCTQTYTEDIGKSLLSDDFLPAVSWYVNLIWEDLPLSALLLECVPDEFSVLLEESVIYTPIVKLFAEYSIYGKDFFIDLNVDYMFHGMLGFTKTWLNHPEQMTREEAIQELELLCRKPVQLFLEKLRKLDTKGAAHLSSETNKKGMP